MHRRTFLATSSLLPATPALLAPRSQPPCPWETLGGKLLEDGRTWFFDASCGDLWLFGGRRLGWSAILLYGHMHFASRGLYVCSPRPVDFIDASGRGAFLYGVETRSPAAVVGPSVTADSTVDQMYLIRDLSKKKPDRVFHWGPSYTPGRTPPPLCSVPLIMDLQRLVNPTIAAML